MFFPHGKCTHPLPRPLISTSSLCIRFHLSLNPLHQVQIHMRLLQCTFLSSTHRIQFLSIENPQSSEPSYTHPIWARILQRNRTKRMFIYLIYQHQYTYACICSGVPKASLNFVLSLSLLVQSDVIFYELYRLSFYRISFYLVRQKPYCISSIPLYLGLPGLEM